MGILVSPKSWFNNIMPYTVKGCDFLRSLFNNISFRESYLRDCTLGNIPIPDKEFGDKNCALGSSHLGVVGYQNVLDAVF